MAVVRANDQFAASAKLWTKGQEQHSCGGQQTHPSRLAGVDGEARFETFCQLPLPAPIQLELAQIVLHQHHLGGLVGHRFLHTNANQTAHPQHQVSGGRIRRLAVAWLPRGGELSTSVIRRRCVQPIGS